jgi:lysozyme family protein
VNAIGYIASAGFAGAWACAVVVWFFAAYHMYKSHARLWQSNPASVRLLTYALSLGRKVPRVTAQNKLTEADALAHRKKSFVAGAIFVGLCGVAIVMGLIGNAWGGWPK